jgi:hypothetical protein
MVQLPAVNTPQFNWCRTRLPDHPQPVPPIFQPEVPAEAVYWAAHHRRRELDVGGSAVKAIFGNKLSPRSRVTSSDISWGSPVIVRGAANRTDTGARGIMRTTDQMFSLRQLLEDAASKPSTTERTSSTSSS